MPDDGYRREIIGGSLLVTPAPTGGHQRVLGKLLAVLQAAEPADAMAIVAPYDWKLPDGGSVEPDVLVIRRQDFDPAGPLPASAVPLLVVEVLSPSNPAQDRMLKRVYMNGWACPPIGSWIRRGRRCWHCGSSAAVMTSNSMVLAPSKLRGPSPSK